MATQKALANQPQEETKFKILDAAAKIFGEYGYHNATMTKISEEAGVAKGTVYWYFSSKEDLFLGLLDSAFDKLYSRVTLVLASHDELLKKFERFIVEYLNFFGGQSHLGKIANKGGIQGLSADFHQRMLAWQAKFTKVNADLIAQGVANGVFRGDINYQQMARVFGGVIAAIGSEYILNSDEINQENEANLIFTMMLEGIGSKRA